jgi:putative oxidoreductase
MNKFKEVAMGKVLGRIFLSTIFILFGISSIMNWDVAYTDLDTAIVNWQMYEGNPEVIGSVLDGLTSYVDIILGVGLFLELVGGLLVFFGYKPKLGAAFLAIFLLFTTLLYFPFWFYEGEQLNLNLVLFLKNVSIFGGVLLLFSGKGSSRQRIEMLDDDM